MRAARQADLTAARDRVQRRLLAELDSTLDALFAAAKHGDVRAAIEVLNRLLGKPLQMGVTAEVHGAPVKPPHIDVFLANCASATSSRSTAMTQDRNDRPFGQCATASLAP